MGRRARNEMIRDRFITAQRSCGLRRHLEGVPLHPGCHIFAGDTTVTDCAGGPTGEWAVTSGRGHAIVFSGARAGRH